jgi:predicted Zn finger-like uncharacterized protein
MIIECPACSTRYDIKAMLPPEGRTVRCAKCGTVWRAMPAGSSEEQETVQKEHAESESVTPDPESMEQGGGSEPVPRGVSHSEDPPFPQAGRGIFSATEEESARSEAIVQEPASGSAYDEPSEQDKTAEDDRSKVRWFSSFRRKNSTREKSDSVGEFAEAPVTSTGETIPFPRATPIGERQMPSVGENQTLEEAREAVRSVFSSLGDGRPSGGVRGFSSPLAHEAIQEHSGPQSREESLHVAPTETSTENRWSQENAYAQGFVAAGVDEVQAGNWTNPVQDEQGAEEDRRDVAEDDDWNGIDDGEAQHTGSRNQSWGIEAGGSRDESDPDSSFRDALRAHFSQPQAAGAAAQDLERHFQSFGGKEEEFPTRAPEGFWKRPSLPLNELIGGAPAVEEDANEAKEDDGSFDQRLYREIEETQEHASQPVRRSGSRGGLALAAAWGLFLCIAAGLVIGFLSFRDIVADALPGVAPLYRKIGIPVTVQPLIFEGVQYEWTLSDNKPALHISGSVYNRAQRKVRAPEFFITIKDQDPALDREYSANLQGGSKIKAGHRSDFEIELLSPNTTVTSVELELRNVH